MRFQAFSFSDWNTKFRQKAKVEMMDFNWSFPWANECRLLREEALKK